MKAKLQLEASASGDEEIIRLADELDKLSDTASQVGPEFGALAAEVDKLGQQRQAIDAFEQLKAATAEAAQRAQQLQQATRQAALALKEKQAALAAASAAEQAANAQAALARERQEEMGAAVKQLGAELRVLATSVKASGEGSAAMTEKLAEGKAQLATLKSEYKAAGEQVAALGRAQRDAARASAEAARDTGAAQREFDGLRKSAAGAKSALADNSQELQRARDGLVAVGVSSGELADHQVRLNKALAASRAKLVELADQAEQASTVLANRELLGVRAHAEVQREIDKTRQAYEALRDSGKLSGAELAQAALKTEERIRELKAQTNGWVESLGKARTAFAGLAAGGAGVAVVAREAIRFESAMADVAKVVDGTDQQMAALTRRIKDMTAVIPLAATELARIAAAGGQLGVPVEQLGEFIELAAQMATAFGMSAEQAGQAVAKLANVFNLPLANVRALGDAINQLGNTTAATEAGIVEVLTRIGGSARQFGLTAEQAAALGAAMLSLGVSSEVAGTGINALLTKLLTAKNQTPEFQAALGELGISAKQLGRDIRDNPQKALTDFLATLAKIEGGRQAELLGQLFGLEYQDDIARLLGGLDAYQKALAGVTDTAATAGAMQKEFEARVKTTEAQLQLMMSGLQATAINLGSLLLPAIVQVAQGLGDASRAVADFVERFPAVTAVAGTLAATAASVGALRLAWLSMGVVASKSLAALGAALPALNKSVGESAAAAGKMSTAFNLAAGALAAFGVGWDAGEYLRKEFLVVEQAGISLAAGLTSMAARAQAAWQLMKAPFTDDTAEAVQERLRLKLQQIDDEYAALFVSAARARDAQTGQAAAADAAGAAAERQAGAQAKAAQATGDAATQADALSAKFAALKDGADGVTGALNAVAESLKIDEKGSVEAFVRSLDQLRSTGEMSAEQFGSAWQQALGKLTTAQIDQLQLALTVARDKGVITAQQWAAVNEQILLKSFNDLGVNGAQALGRVSEGAQKAIDSVARVAQTAEKAGVDTVASARAIEMAFAAAVPKADSLEAIAAMERQLQALGNAGKLSAEGVKRTQEALDKQRATIEAQLPGIQSLDEALRQLGVKPQAELQALARQAKESFDFIRDSGKAAPREINEAWKAMAEATIAANNGVADATLKSQAAAHGFAITTDASGKSIVESMKKAEEATRGVGEAAAGSAAAMDDMGNVAWKIGEDLVEQARRHNAALGELKGTWIDATAAASRYSAEMAELVYDANKNVADMRREHQMLVEQMEALERQQRQLQEQGGDAARGVDELRQRLLELNGTEEEIARGRLARDKAETQRKAAQLQLDLQRAQLTGKSDEAARLQREIALLNEQLVLLDKVFAEEEKQRKARERGGSGGSTAGGSGGAGGGGGSGGGGLSAPAAPQSVSITLNANGVNDPGQLARMIEPELKKLARLAR